MSNIGNQLGRVGSYNHAYNNSENYSQLKLAGESSDIVVEEAKFNIVAIKIKPEKDPSIDEVEKEKKEVEDEKTEIETEQAEIEKGDSADLAKEKDTVEKPEKRRERIAKGKSEHSKNEKEHLEKMEKDDSSIRFIGPYIYDAVKGEMDSALGKVEIPDGSYKRVEFKLRRNFSAEETDPLLGNVFYIKGSYKTTPFLIEYHVAMNLRVAGESAAEVFSGESNPIAVLFNTDNWFEGVDFASAELTDGSIVINKDSNKELLKVIRKNIKEGLKFGKDENKDGKIGEDEVAGEGVDTEDSVEASE